VAVLSAALVAGATPADAGAAASPSVLSGATRTTIIGRVTDTDGHALANVRVSVYLDAATITGRDGRYRLQVGTASGDAFFNIDGALARGGSSDQRGYGGVSRILRHLSPGAVRHLATVRLRSAGALRGRVTDSAGHPLSGVEAYLQPVIPYVPIQDTSVSYGFVGIRRFRTNAQGRFVIKGASRYAGRVCFDADHAPVVGGTHDRLGYQSTCLPDSAALRSGTTRTLPVTELAPQAGSVLTGTVRAAGRPVPHHVIQIFGDHTFSTVSVRTDRRGRYRIGGRRADRYHVCSWSRAPRKLFAYGLPSKCLQVRVAAHRVVTAPTLRIPAAGAARGRLVAVNGSPVVGAQISVERLNHRGYGIGRTGPAGRYRISGLLPGRYRACNETTAAKAHGLRWGVSPGECTAPFRVRVRTTASVAQSHLNAGGAVVGRITDQNGHAATHVSVSAGFISVDVGRDGRYRLTGLAAGAVRVCAFRNEGLSFSQRCRRGVTVAAGRATTVNMAMPQLGSVQVQVHDAAGQPVTGANAALLAPCGRDRPCPRYSLFGRGAAVRDSEDTGADGLIHLTGIRPGRYAVCLHGYFATTTGGTPQRGYADTCTGDTFTVVVRRGQLTRVALTLGQGSVLAGRVTDLDGQPLRNVLVHVGLSGADDYGRDPWVDDPLGTDDPATYSRTDADGYYRIRSVVPGRQRVCFDARDASGGSSTQGYRSQCVGGQPGTLDGGSRIDVAGTTQVDFQLSPGQDDAASPLATTWQPRTCADVGVARVDGRTAGFALPTCDAPALHSPTH
jgi:protocatechuate 3,4-dioxygenase beta subunit